MGGLTWVLQRLADGGASRDTPERDMMADSRAAPQSGRLQAGSAAWNSSSKASASARQLVASAAGSSPADGRRPATVRPATTITSPSTTSSSPAGLADLVGPADLAHDTFEVWRGGPTADALACWPDYAVRIGRSIGEW